MTIKNKYYLLTLMLITACGGGGGGGGGDTTGGGGGGGKLNTNTYNSIFEHWFIGVNTDFTLTWSSTSATACAHQVL